MRVNFDSVTLENPPVALPKPRQAPSTPIIRPGAVSKKGVAEQPRTEPQRDLVEARKNALSSFSWEAAAWFVLGASSLATLLISIWF